MPRTRRRGTLLEQHFGFSADELDANIDDAKLARINAAVDLGLGENGIHVLKQFSHLGPLNLNGILGKVIESCINEIILYKALQEYRNRFNEEFIAVFAPDEQIFLRHLCGMLDQYILIQEPYAKELLSIVGYSSAEEFAEDLIVIEEINAAVNARKTQNKDLFAKIAIVMGTHREFAVIHMRNKLKEGDLENKLSRFFSITLASLQEANEIPMRMSPYGRRFRNMSAYYAQSTLKRHTKRREQFTRVEAIPTYSGCGYDLQAFFARTIVTGRTLTFKELAGFLDDKWELPSIGNVSEYFKLIYLMAERNTRQIVESEREYTLCLMSSLKENNPENAEKGLIYIDESTRQCVIRNSNGVPCKIKLPQSFTKETESRRSELPLDLTNLELKLNGEALVRNVIIFLSEARYIHGDEDSARVKPPKSVTQLSLAFGAAARAVNYLGGSSDESSASPLKVKKGHFLGAPADLCIQMSFSQCLQTIQSSGCNLVYRRANGKLKRMNFATMNNFEEDDFAEIYYNRHLLCTFVPQNIIGDYEDIFNGVGIIVPELEPKQIALITRILIGALAKSGRKEIYINYNTASKGSKKTSAVLMYAEAVLNTKAIPLLVDDTRTSKPEESRIALQSLPCSEAQSKLFSDYDVIVDRIYQEQEEDKHFLSEFTLFLEQSSGNSLETWTKVAIAFRLTEIMLHRHNLALDEFMEKMIDYVRKTISSEMPSQKDRDAIKKEIRKMLQPFYGSQKSGVSSERWGAKIFNLVSKKLGSAERISDDEIKNFQDERFLKQFDAWLEKLGSCEEGGYLLLWDLRTFDEFNELLVLTRFREIFLSAPGLVINESYFLTRIKHFTRLLEPEFLTRIDREDISLMELLDGLLFVLTEKAENDTKFLNYFDSALKNFPFPAAGGEGLIIEESTGAILHEAEILQRLKKIVVGHHTICKKEFIEKLRLFVRKLNLHLVVSGPEGYEDKELVGKLITALEFRRQKDRNFLEAFDKIFLRDAPSESRFYRFTMIDPDTQENDEQEELNEYYIASRLACIFLQHGNIDKSNFLKRFKIISEKLNLKLPVDIDECKNEEFAKSVERLLSDFKEKQVENKYFLGRLQKTLEESRHGKVVMKDSRTGRMLYEMDILKRLEEIAMVDRTIDEKSYQEILFLFAKTFSPDLYGDMDLNSEVSALKIMEDLSCILKKRQQQDHLFIEALDRALESIENSQIDGYAIIMIDPNTGEELNQHGIISQLATLFFAHGSIDRAVFADKFERLSKKLKLKWLSGQASIGDLGNEQAVSDRDLRRIVNSELLSLKKRSEQDNEFLRDLDKILQSRSLYPNNAIAIEDPEGKGMLSEKGVLQYLKKIAIEHRTIDKITFLTILRQFAQALPLDMQQYIDLKSISEPLVLLENILGVLNRRQEVERPRMATGANIENVRKENPGEVFSEKEQDESLRKGRSRKLRMASTRSVDEALQGFPKDPSSSAASVARYKQNGSLRSLVTNLKKEIDLDSNQNWRFEESSDMTEIYDKQTLVFTAGENKPASKPSVPQESVSSLSVQDVYLEVHRHNDSDVSKAVNAMAKTMGTMKKPKLEIEVISSDNRPERIVEKYIRFALNKKLFPEVIFNGEKVPYQTLYEGLLKIDKDLAKQYKIECERGRLSASSCSLWRASEAGPSSPAPADQKSTMIPVY